MENTKKKMPKVTKVIMISVFSLLGLFIIAAIWGSNDPSIQAQIKHDDSLAKITEKNTTLNASIPSYLNADSIKEKLTKSMNLFFIATTPGTVCANYIGYEGEYNSKRISCDDCNTVTICFNQKTKEIFYISCDLQGVPLNPKISDVEMLFDFYEQFNNHASDYFKNKFNKMVSDKKYFDDTDPFLDSVTKLKYTFDHTLFSARKVIKNEDDKQLHASWCNISGEISNKSVFQ